MEKFKVSFVANNQQLTATGTKHASDTYADIEATFTLGERWTDMDTVSAVWWNGYTRIATVLDSEGKCTVPYEVLTRKGCVRVNLVGSVVEDGELVTRLTSYSAEAVHVNEKIKLTGNEPQTITPSQYEQFVENVKADADRAESAKESAETASASAQGYAQSASASATSASESATASEQSATASARDAQTVSEIAVEVEVMKNEAELARDEILGMRAEAVTLPAGSEATASYADGLLSLGIPRGNTGATGAKGDKGDTGATPNLTIGEVETLEPTESATATITGTAENPVLNLGIPQGQTGEVSLADLSTLLPTDTASGDIASFPDGQSVIPLVSLIADIEPIQALNGYDKPWAGGAGTNMIDADNPLTFTTIKTISFATPIPSGTMVYAYSSSHTYATEPSSGSKVIAMRFEDANNQGVGRTYANSTGLYRVTLTGDAVRVRLYSNGYNYIDCVDVTVTVNDLMVSKSPITAYEPYSNICPISGRTEVNTIVSPTTSVSDGTTYTTALGQTVYGGVLDVVSGELVVDRAMVTLDGTENGWSYNSATLGFIRTVDEMKSGNAQNGLSDKFATISNNGSFGVRFGGNNKILYFNHITDNISGVTDLESWKSWLADNPTQICYELATPQTIQLTPQEVYALLGQNNVWADSGEVEVVYKADVTKWVEKKLS